ncbi:MAG: GGDEF domain-containing protein, partial [Cyanobacteriota bacterium]
VAERIREVIHSDDLAARMGGDEMVVVLCSVADLDAAVAVAETIAAAISRPIQGEEIETMITASIGVALAKPAEGVDALIARADIAMYQAKLAGRARVIRID